MRSGFTALLILTAGLAAGCSIALPPYNEPFEERLLIVARDPTAYEIALEGSEAPAVPVPADGKAVLHVPVLPRECSTYFLGIKVKDRGVEQRKLILILRHGRVVKKLSVNKLRRLPTGPAGYHRLELR